MGFMVSLVPVNPDMFRDNYEMFYSKPMNKWWDGYKGEKVVLLDDF